VALHGRKGFVCFDADVMTNPKVQLALSRLVGHMDHSWRGRNRHGNFQEVARSVRDLGGGGCSVARRFDMVLHSPHASEKMRTPERNVLQLDVEETMRNPDREYPSRWRPELTVAEKAFPSQGVVRVVYAVEPADVALEKYARAMEKLHPGWREHSEALDAQLREKLPVREEPGRAYTVATVVTVIRMKRKRRTGDGGR
jgi:hypothetical protein